MPRGQTAADGHTYIAKNGYHYTKVDGKNRLTHHIIAEQVLGRPLQPDETVRFKDGDRTNLKPENVNVTTRKTSLAGRIATLNDKIRELTAERDHLQAKLDRERAAKSL